MKRIFGGWLRSLGMGQLLHKARINQRLLLGDLLFVPPGHYYSPIVTRQNLAEEERQLSRAIPRQLPEIALDETAMLDRLTRMNFAAKPLSLPKTKDPSWRYWSDNGSYGANDAHCLAGIARVYQRRRIIEVGCGFSSALILDLNDREWNKQVELSFVDPDLQQMMRLLNEEEKTRVKLTQSRLQDMDPAFFTSLQANDILFIDSTHVAKTGSDVLYLFFELLPRLASGVLIHMHDISWPFEYPKQWIAEGRSWNESYFLRAFLMHNRAYEIILCNSWLFHFHPDAIRAAMPGVPLEGGNIWLRKV